MFFILSTAVAARILQFGSSCTASIPKSKEQRIQPKIIPAYESRCWAPPKTNQNLRTPTPILEVRTPIAQAIWGKIESTPKNNNRHLPACTHNNWHGKCRMYGRNPAAILVNLPFFHSALSISKLPDCVPV